jgi:signal transduction histidine kinase
MKIAETRSWTVVVGLVVIVSALHYGTPLLWSFTHELFARFFYLPVVLAGLLMGLRAGVAVALLVVVIYSPHVILGWGGIRNGLLDKSLEIVLFILSGALVGWLADRERLQRARAQELQRLASLGEAAATVAHEMKNALMPIRGFLRRMKRDFTKNPQYSKYLEAMERSAARLETMTGDMLSFASCRDPDIRTAKVADIVTEIMAEIEHEAARHSVRVRCQCPDSAIEAEMDPVGIKQVLYNLLQNAVHASKPGQEVSLLVQKNERKIIFQVQDQGKGIPPELAERIFRPFFTTKPYGTGLGLPISKRIVESHGGRLLLESAPGSGTCLTLELPLRRQFW